MRSYILLIISTLFISFISCGGDDDFQTCPDCDSYSEAERPLNCPSSCLDSTLIDIFSADFVYTNPKILLGQPVQFEDKSTGNPETWEWTFEGGTPNKSNLQNPIITYNNKGVFAVTLNISKHDTVHSTNTKNFFINVTDNRRYYAANFEVKKTRSIIYGINAASHVLNLYEPKDDTLNKRPIVVIMGGGGFDYASDLDAIEPLAMLLASHGIVAATARYRTGPITNNQGQPDGRLYYTRILETQQDSKAAVRFFRKNDTTYHIDPDLILLGGWSSGAIGGLAHAYWSEDELDEDQIALYPEGGVEGEQGNPEYSSRIAGFICLAGEMAVGLDLIVAGDPPFFGVCTENDTKTICGIGKTQNGFPKFGPSAIAAHAKMQDIHADNYTFDGADHRNPVTNTSVYFNQLMEWIRVIILD